MKQFLLTLFLLTILASCSSQPTESGVVLNENLVLILAPQGVDPEKDTIGFNNLTLKVTQAFSSGLVPRLKQFGKTTINVVDQNTKYSFGQKMAIYSVKERAKTTVVLSLEAANVGGDERLNLRAQWVDQRPNIENGSMRGVTANSVIERVYVLRGSKSGDNPKSMDELAADFVSAVKAQGKL